MEGVHSLVDKRGIPALAYAKPDALPWKCTLTILCEPEVRFMLSLAAPVMIHGLDDEQLFTLCFHGDNLVPGKSSLEDGGIRVPAELSNTIFKTGKPKLRTMMLKLHASCSMWCPRTLDSVVSTFDTSCEQLVHLANATEVWLMFDGKALRKGNDNRLRSAVKGRKQLRGIHINSDFQFALNHQEASSSTLKYVKFVESESKEGAIARLPPLLEAAMDHTKPGANPSAEDAMLNVLLSIEDVAEEAVSSSDTPPSYESVSLGKRPRTSNSPTSSLVAKRFFQDVTYAPSGAGRAQSTTSSTNTVQVDLFQDAITTAVKSVLPDMLIAELPTIVRESISVLLARSPYPSSKPPAYQISNALEQHCSTPSHKSTAAAVLRADVSEHTKSYLEELLNNVAEQVSEQVEELHSQHVSNVEEMLDDHKTNVRQVEEDQMAYLNEKGNEKLAELETSMDDIKERMAGEVEETVDAVENTVLYNLLVEMQRRCECKCKCAGSGKDKPALKAMSLPP